MSLSSVNCTVYSELQSTRKFGAGRRKNTLLKMEKYLFFYLKKSYKHTRGRIPLQIAIQYTSGA
jgi:hypothetical protein